VKKEISVAPAFTIQYRHLMIAAEALEKQILCYRRMTGEQRLAIALDLHEMSCEIARGGIRRKNPLATAEEVERLLHKRLELVRS
jgi:hypothetical protein